jgi:acetoin utilization deacetylase AcuC-like enzyme
VAEHAGSGGLFQEDADTVGSPATYDAALHAAGAVLNAVDAVMEGRAANAFCAVRPPGHHAERDRAMGFCFFNNVAIAARHLRDRHRLRRIAILDWDVHHGNGTQNAFYADPGVFYFSVHQFPHYPGTGRRSERGIAGGAGFTLNVPLRAGSGDEDYRRVFSGELRPAMDNFRPDFILISAGFDAHRDDPLSEMLLTEAGFRDLTDAVLDMAARYAEDRIVSVLEGGYNLDAAAASVEAHLRSLMRA